MSTLESYLNYLMPPEDDKTMGPRVWRLTLQQESGAKEVIAALKAFYDSPDVEFKADKKTNTVVVTVSNSAVDENALVTRFESVLLATGIMFSWEQILGESIVERDLKKHPVSRFLKFLLGREYTELKVTKWLKSQGWARAGIELVRVEPNGYSDSVKVTVTGPSEILDRMKYNVAGTYVTDSVTAARIEKLLAE